MSDAALPDEHEEVERIVALLESGPICGWPGPGEIHAVVRALRSLPVEQRMAAMGMERCCPYLDDPYALDGACECEMYVEVDSDSGGVA